jgi:hypothetical protein
LALCACLTWRGAPSPSPRAAGLNVFTISPDRARSIARATWTEGRFRRMNGPAGGPGRYAWCAAMAYAFQPGAAVGPLPAASRSLKIQLP